MSAPLLRFPWLLVAFALSVFPPTPGRAVSGYVAADPSAPVVTEENLLASERFWPYWIELTQPWQPEGRAEPLAAGTRGVLVRVEAAGMARVDFGRDGRYAVPVAKTDVVQGSNRVRRGELGKLAPNLVHAIGPRLVDSASESIRPLDFATTFEPPGFLAVFAAPDDFAELAAALAPLHERHGVWTVLFPQGRHDDPELRRQLRSLEWTVPFLRDEYGEGYTRSLLAEGTPIPAVVLQTREGRVLFQRTWSREIVPELAAALDAAFGAKPAPAAALEPAP